MLRRLQFGVGTPRIPEESPTISRSESAKSQEGFPGLNAASGLRQSQLASPSSLSVPSAVSSGTPGTLLLPLCPFLKCYSLFVQNFSRSLARIDQEERTNPAWKRFANERKKAGHDRGLGLSGMLLAVVQRIPRYRLLLDDLLQRTEEDHLDYADLIRATQSVEQGQTTFASHGIMLMCDLSDSRQPARKLYKGARCYPTPARTTKVFYQPRLCPCLTRPQATLRWPAHQSLPEE